MPTPTPLAPDSRPGRFRPTHCARRDCPAHTISSGFRYRFRGSYRTKAEPRRRVRVIECLHCGRQSSMNAYRATYYMKRPRLLRDVAAILVNGCAHRQVARIVDCAPSTVTRLAARLGRHCMLFQAEALERLGPPSEPIVFDHFVTFVHSQLDRLGIGTPIGATTWFDYGAEAAASRGGSRRASRKKPVRSPLPARRPGSEARSLRRALDRLMSRESSLELITDDHPGYRSGIAAATHGSRVRHRVHPNPDRADPAAAAAARARDRALFTVDMVHQLTRHSLAHHRRETIAFARRANAAMERAMLFTVWRNFVKRRSERRPDDRCPAMLLGLVNRRLRWADVLARRRFPDRVRLSRSWTAVYRRELITPAVGRNLRHELVHAF
jgi:hypothetical protein